MMVTDSLVQAFSLPLLAWYDKYGRKNLPWQHPRSAYRVWVSEIMLQQTQVKTVIPYFERFINRFPNVNSLAKAPEDHVLAHWSGLGYYSRARNLHKTAQLICTEFEGCFPSTPEQLVTLPGIGASTAAAIASLAFDKPTAILDANVQRVLSRYFLVGNDTGQAAMKQTLWQLANDCMPKVRCADYTQAIMDLGATCCTTKQPNCLQCPLQNGCLAHREDTISQYPPKKMAPKKPVKYQQFLLLHSGNNDSIYLEKREPTGVWGGLWCLPSLDIEHCPITYIENTYSLSVQNVQELMQIKHTFSHFHLHITALTLQITVPKEWLKSPPGYWFGQTELATLGLAKPIQTILQRFFSEFQ